MTQEQKDQTFETLQNLVVQWALARQIIPNSNAMAQLLKTMSELGELADATLKNDHCGVIDGIGDVLVTLILYTELYNAEANAQLDLTYCLEEAYNTIKDRRGTLTPEGIFVKETA